MKGLLSSFKIVSLKPLVFASFRGRGVWDGVIGRGGGGWVGCHQSCVRKGRTETSHGSRFGAGTTRKHHGDEKENAPRAAVSFGGERTPAQTQQLQRRARPVGRAHPHTQERQRALAPTTLRSRAAARSRPRRRRSGSSRRRRACSPRPRAPWGARGRARSRARSRRTCAIARGKNERREDGRRRLSSCFEIPQQCATRPRHVLTARLSRPR